MTVKIYQLNKEGKETVSYSFNAPESDFATEVCKFIVDFGKLKSKWNAKKTRICNGATKGKWFLVTSNGSHWTNSEKFKSLGFSLKYSDKADVGLLSEMMADVEGFVKARIEANRNPKLGMAFGLFPFCVCRSIRLVICAKI